MYVLNHIHVGPTFNGTGLHISDSPMFSGGGTQPPKGPKKKTPPKPKKR